jgi:hypothetical protein
MSGQEVDRAGLAEAELEALATSWPVAETDEEIDAILNGLASGGAL